MIIFWWSCNKIEIILTKQKSNEKWLNILKRVDLNLMYLWIPLMRFRFCEKWPNNKNFWTEANYIHKKIHCALCSIALHALLRISSLIGLRRRSFWEMSAIFAQHQCRYWTTFYAQTRGNMNNFAEQNWIHTNLW